MAIVGIPLFIIFLVFAYFAWRFVSGIARSIFGKKPGQPEQGQVQGRRRERT